jgi:hypothetical protein
MKIRPVLRKSFFGLVGVFAVAQFFRPEMVAPPADPANDMLLVAQAPTDIAALVTTACYDCHSHRTVYPWYSHITPVNYWLQHHVDEGRGELNFSQWNEYHDSEAAAACGEEVLEEHMPLPSYLWTHTDAQLTSAQRAQLAEWFDGALGNERGSKR